MARTPAYPVELVQNFADAVRQSNPRDYVAKPPAPTDLMILRALLAHPLIDPQASIADQRQLESGPNGSGAARLH
jgi:hypothetical protein